MLHITINGNPVQAREGATVLEASREDKYAFTQFDIDILSLNYLKGVQQKDTSGLCIAEVAGKGIVNASITPAEDGMEITTNSLKIRERQKEVLKQILAHHDLDCRNCHRTGNCELQEIQYVLRTTKKADEKAYKKYSAEKDGIIIRDHNKCVRCGRCVAACQQGQGIGAIKMDGEGFDGKVVAVNGTLAESGCVSCGQCIAVCPVGALREQDDTDRIFELIRDPEKYVIVQVAPSVRASLGEMFENYPIGSETKGKLAAALRRLGFDRVFDTVLGADLTVMEEAHEFLQRLKEGTNLPMYTSCCPGWISYCENMHGELLNQISSCKSPQQMFGAMVKTYLAEKEGLDKDRIVVVSVMPCTAKKVELARKDESAAGVPDVDFSITNRELGRMIQRADISFMELENEESDSPLGIGSGAGTIFGATGGVMEAALRTANDWVNGIPQEKLEYQEVRGIDGVKEAVYEIGDQSVRVAAVSGLHNLEQFLKKVQAGETKYDFVEVMACPGGCVNGGGQPQQTAGKRTIIDIRKKRAESLYRLDMQSSVRKSYENSAIREIYDTCLGEPGSDKAHRYLHTTYQAKGEQV